MSSTTTTQHWSNFQMWLKKFDQFGKPVVLTIDGEEEFRTVFGGLSSIAFASYLIYILVISFIPVVFKEIDT
jgi:hypothetical protein